MRDLASDELREGEANDAAVSIERSRQKKKVANLSRSVRCVPRRAKMKEMCASLGVYDSFFGQLSPVCVRYENTSGNKPPVHDDNKQ